ncbi:hypothetical protein DH2020_001554 [Rehmannia glutinosa]|uniref:CUE domain-containing protein n=1 Tax=Rehmannia glutinosa TaxID=99300 RepID=A0ABR0Y0F8_REHGL
MGFDSVYMSLQELFPQLDARALRAAAIEHSKDVDAAVVAVLEEIVPFFVERSEPTLVVNFNCGNQQSSHDAGDDAGDGPSEPFYDAYDGHREGEGAELTLSEKNNENRMKMSHDVFSHGKPVALFDLNANSLPIEVSEALETEETLSGDKCIKMSSDRSPQHTLGTLQDADMGPNQNMNFTEEDVIALLLETDFSNVGNKENDLKLWADGNDLVDRTDVTVSPLESSARLVEAPDTRESNLEKLEVSLSTDTASNTKTMSNIVVTEDVPTLNATMSQSSQTRIIDVVEEMISDARNNKKTLFTSMESVISLMRQVELKERAAEKAKEEAAKGGKNILDKVEELKQMLQHAKEANDMHAGEVYGEKAILATELRELQSHVLSLSDERDKSLEVLDEIKENREMRQILEVQLAALENEIQSAEQEKLEKENVARKLLADQELIMEKVVQESKILNQLASDHAELQEFLVDRGRVVDMLHTDISKLSFYLSLLHSPVSFILLKFASKFSSFSLFAPAVSARGEIGVICQDVRVLKAKFDENVPLSKSLSSNETSFILASSNSSSLQSPIPDQVEPIALPPEDALLENQKTEEKAAVDDLKTLHDEGWDLVDDLA